MTRPEFALEGKLRLAGIEAAGEQELAFRGLVMAQLQTATSMLRPIVKPSLIEAVER